MTTGVLLATCPRCLGTGDVIGRDGWSTTCPRCHGDGRINPERPRPRTPGRAVTLRGRNTVHATGGTRRTLCAIDLDATLWDDHQGPVTCLRCLQRAEQLTSTLYSPQHPVDDDGVPVYARMVASNGDVAEVSHVDDQAEPRVRLTVGQQGMTRRHRVANCDLDSFQARRIAAGLFAAAAAMDRLAADADRA